MEEKIIKKDEERLKVLQKIEEYERRGLFDQDVEEDPIGKELLPNEINYLKKTFLGEIKRFIAFRLAYRFMRKARKNKQIILNKTVGIENLQKVKGGVIITCNHFNAFDSFVMHLIFDESKRKKRMYRIIREGNYTAFKGFFGLLMRNCDTLPLSSNRATMLKFLRAIDKALKEENAVLIYPEQSMWWNYRKPKPLKNGAFDFAVKNNVPIVPIFITLKDSDIIGQDGFPVQEYTPFVGEPIYPDNTLSKNDARDKMKELNFAYFKSVYENFYQTPLTYTTEKD